MHYSPAVPLYVQPGQILLAVDLLATRRPQETFAQLQALGYTPQIRYVAHTTGVRALAVLKDDYWEQASVDYLRDEWTQLCTVFPADFVYLWRGQQAD